MEKFKVKFLPDNKSCEVFKDTSILSAAADCGIYLNSSCGGNGVCGKCRIILKKGKVKSESSAILSKEEKKQNIYLACLAFIQEDTEVFIPEESRQDYEKLSKAEIDERIKGLFSPSEDVEAEEIKEKEAVFDYQPLSKKIYLELPKPNLKDNLSDLERILRQLFSSQDSYPELHTEITDIRRLGDLLRDSQWKITLTLARKMDSEEIIQIEPENNSFRNFGLCFDIGTTTITGQLINLNNKEIIGTRASYNRQAAFGSDVITRIIYAQEEGGLEKLHLAVVETINQIIKELTDENNIHLNEVTYILCTGNTTMIHLLLEIDPKFIRKEPYVPTANFLPSFKAVEVGINIHPRAILSCVPGVASYVGGDTTSGILSSGIYRQEELALLIDIGTNGEIALGNKDFLVSCAASAGPAFEGSGVSCGMRAGRGAIQKAEIIKDNGLKIIYKTIHDAKPRGICGSGYIDLLAQMLKKGIIDKSGKIKINDKRRVREGENGKEFIVVFKEDADSTQDIIINEADIENLKRAKAAIFSATAILISRMNLELDEIKNIFIAGGFGTYLDIDSAITIGLLPDLDKGRFKYIGNSALSGTRQALLSYAAFKKTHDIARKTTYFELSTEPAYMDEYMAALFFPHTDLSKFPSIKF